MSDPVLDKVIWGERLRQKRVKLRRVQCRHQGRTRNFSLTHVARKVTSRSAVMWNGRVFFRKEKLWKPGWSKWPAEAKEPDDIPDEEVIRAIVTVPMHFANTPTLVQCVSSSNTNNTGVIVGDFTIPFPNKTLANNLIIFAFNYATQSVTVSSVKTSDGTSMTLGKAAADAGNGTTAALYYRPGSPAGITNCKVTFSAATNYVGGLTAEFYNILTSSANDTTGNSHISSGTALTAGSITTTVDGDLVFSYFVLDNLSVNLAWGGLWTAGASQTALALDDLDGQAAQFIVQGVHGAINSGMTISPTQAYIGIGYAWFQGAAGTAPAAGILYVLRALHQNINNTTSPLTLQLPTGGNLNVIGSIMEDSPTNVTISSIADNVNAGNYTSTGAVVDNTGSGNVYMHYYPNATASLALKLTITTVSNQAPLESGFVFYDIMGAATSPFYIRGTATGSQSSAGNITAASVTTRSANSLVIAMIGVTNHTIAGVLGGYVFNSTTYTAQDGNVVHSQADEDNGWATNAVASPNVALSQWTVQPAGTFVGNWASLAAVFESPAPAAPPVPPVLEIFQGPPVRGTPWFSKVRPTESGFLLGKPQTLAPKTPEIAQGPPMRGSPWVNLLVPPEAAWLVAAPIPAAPVNPEVRQGPPLRGAPWVQQLPLTDGLQGPTSLIQWFQGNTNTFGKTSSPVSVPFLQNVLAGDLIEVTVSTYSSLATLTVTDSLGQSYSQAGNYASTTLDGVAYIVVSKWFVLQSLAGPCTVTVQASAAVFLSITINEYRPPTPLSVDSTVAQSVRAAPPASCGPVLVTGKPADLVTAAIGFLNAFWIVGSTNPPFLVRGAASVGGAKPSLINADDVSAYQTESATFFVDASDFTLGAVVGVSYRLQGLAPSQGAVSFEIQAGPPMRGVPFIQRLPITEEGWLAMQAPAVPIAPGQSYPGEIRMGPPMHAPWIIQQTENGLLVIAPPPVVAGPPSISFEINAGPPMRGAPWQQHLPIEDAWQVKVRFPPVPPAPPTPGKGRAKPFIERWPDVSDPRRLGRITDKISNMLNSLAGQALIQQQGPAKFILRASAIQLARAPTAADDVTTGATVGTVWINTVTQQLWICVANAQGAAVWRGPI